MVPNTKVAASELRPRADTVQVAIMMCTKNGAAFIGGQLQSFVEQTHHNWSLVVSDDGSSDETVKIIERFARGHPQQVTVLNGPKRGACANFISLATNPAIAADYFAFSDQDDVWHPDKLRRALDWLVTMSDDTPSLYCGRTELMSADGRCYGFSPLFTRPPAFQNALVQSLGGGNTMVFNRATKSLLERVGRLDVVLHDWWLYQLVSAAGGNVRYDPQPMLKYRQHPDNILGSNLGWRARFVRIRMTLRGRFRQWNATNIAALESVPDHLIKPQNRAVVTLFAKATSASLLKRLLYLRQSGVYRQTWLGNIGLVAATIIKRI